MYTYYNYSRTRGNKIRKERNMHTMNQYELGVHILGIKQPLASSIMLEIDDEIGNELAC